MATDMGRNVSAVDNGGRAGGDGGWLQASDTRPLRRPWWSVWPWAVIAASLLLVGVSTTVLLDGQVGTLGELLGGAGAVAALGVSLFLIHEAQVLRTRDLDERERAQARLVSAWVGTTEVGWRGSLGVSRRIDAVPAVFIRNTSDQPVYDVGLRPMPYDHSDPADNLATAFLITLQPGETVENYWPESPDQPKARRPLLMFTDSTGVTWERDAYRLTVASSDGPSCWPPSGHPARFDAAGPSDTARRSGSNVVRRSVDHEPRDRAIGQFRVRASRGIRVRCAASVKTGAVKITYTGGPQGLAMLRDLLRAEGFDPHYDPPDEQRSAGQVALFVVLWVADKAVGDAVSDATRAAVRRAVTKVRERFPRAEVDVDDD